MARPESQSNFPSSSTLRTKLSQLQHKTAQGLEYLGTKFTDRIPGLRYSATFLSTLRQNLQLSLALDQPPPPTMSPSPSPSTPPDSIAPPPSTDPPPLTTTTTTSAPPTIAALKLIADSIAQQRQQAARQLLSHPLFLALAFALLAAVAQALLALPHGSWALVATTWAGCVMALLVGVRWMSAGYLELAERVGWGFLGPAEGADGDGDGAGGMDTLVVTRFGEEVIGCVVLRIGPAGETEKGKGKARKKAARKARVRAWTVGLRWRGRGVGRALLEEAVRIAVEERGCESVEFADVHANSGRVMPGIFNGGFERREERARKTLRAVVEAQVAAGRKR